MIHVYRSAGLNGFREFSESMADVCEMDLPEGKDCFRAHGRVRNLGAAMLTEMESCSLRYDRATRHVARSAYDHFQIHLNLAGESHVRSGRQTAVFRAGDIGVLDTTRAAHYAVVAPPGKQARSLSLILPRSLLASLLPRSGSEHCAVLRGDSAIGRQLGAYLIGLSQRTEEQPAADLDRDLQGVVGLLARGLGIVDRTHPSQAASQVALASLKRYIESHIDSPELSTQTICQYSGWSRATVYRLFESDGGLVAYIQQRRLQRALMELLFGRERRRVLDIALESQFSSEATFNRAFRRTFGIPPGEVRSLAQPARNELQSDSRAVAPDDRALVIAWIKRLGKSPGPYVTSPP